MTIINLKTDYRKKPLGIDNMQPMFGWNVDTKKKNWFQKQYRILVSTKRRELGDNRASSWDSGWVVSGSMRNITYQGANLGSNTRYYWKVIIESREGEIAESPVVFFETGLLNVEDWHGKWIGETEDHVYHIFRRTFSVEGKTVKRARLFVCGLGHYEFYINGNRVGDAVLEPGWVQYDKTCFYSSYDVTGLLLPEENAVGIVLGDGMFNVPGGRYVYYKRSYGKAKFLVQLNIELTDGTHLELVSDEMWKMAPSPIRFCCIYGGEDYDGRLEQQSFSKPDFLEEGIWDEVILVEPPQGKLRGQSIEPVRVMERLVPVSVVEKQPGMYLYDFGTNFSGWAKISLKSEGSHEGHVLAMVPGEILTADGLPDQRVTGNGYHWQYTMNEKKIQTYAPRFTYTGFRYLLVTGAVPADLAQDGVDLPIVEELVGEFIYLDVEQNGDFFCSNDLFNQIHTIIVQAMKSNIKSILTDCPHREKLGWLEQTHLIGPGLLYNFDLAALYRKIQQDMADAQHESGLIPDICPEYVVFGYHEGFVDSPEWGSAFIINGWYLYKRTGDMTFFEKYYDRMKCYLDYLTSRAHHHVLHHGLGDWLDIGPMTPYSQNTPVPIIATAIYYYDLQIMAEVAGRLGNREDEAAFRKLMSKVYDEYNKQYFDNQTFRYGTGSQAAQAMSLVVGLTQKENRQKVLDYLVKDITARGYSTTAGDVGHPFVTAALMMHNRSDIVYQMTNITDKPGYGYQIKCGATSLAEEWDGPNPKNPHGSQNHFMLGSIEEWFYAGLAGLFSLRTQNSFDHIQIRPHFAKGITEVKAWTRHPYGLVQIHWECKDGDICIELDIPPNTTATFISELDDSVRHFGSGGYCFTLKNNKVK